MNGGGIWSAGPLTLVRTTVADNAAVGTARTSVSAAASASSGTSAPATFTNTTFSRNTPTASAAASSRGDRCCSQNVSIVGNIAPPPSPGQNGAGFYQQFAPALDP